MFTVSTLLLGSPTALRWSLSPKTAGWILAFGAGALISAISFDLFQEAEWTAERPRVAFFGLAAVAQVYFGGDRWLDRRGGDGRKDIEGNHLGGSPGHRAGIDSRWHPGVVRYWGSLVSGGVVSLNVVPAAFISNNPGGVGIATAGLVATGKRTRDLVLL